MCARLIVGDIDNRSQSIRFSNDRLFSLNLTFPDLSQYPHILHNLYFTNFYLINQCENVRYVMHFEFVYVYHHIYWKWVLLVDSKCRNTVILTGLTYTLSQKVFLN